MAKTGRPKKEKNAQLLHVLVPTKDLEVFRTKLEGRDRAVVIRRLISDFNRGRVQIDWSQD